MNAADPNLPLLEAAVHSLGPLSERFVFVGGCAAGLLITDAAAGSIRATKDVDVVVEVLSLLDYQRLERELEKAGFKHDLRPGAPLCRWLAGDSVLDVMPVDAGILGFGNRWYPHAVESAMDVDLPSGRCIKLISPAVFLATKFEAFRDRGNGDFLASHDLEDIVTVVDGREEIERNIAAAAAPVREYLAREIGALLKNPSFMEALAAHLPGDEASQGRVPFLKERLRNIAAAKGGTADER